MKLRFKRFEQSFEVYNENKHYRPQKDNTEFFHSMLDKDLVGLVFNPEDSEMDSFRKVFEKQIAFTSVMSVAFPESVERLSEYFHSHGIVKEYMLQLRNKLRVG